MTAKDQWDSLWLNANFITCQERSDYHLIYDGAMAVKDGRIAWLGARTDLDALDYEAHLTQSLDGQWVSPALIDCHTHLVYGGNRVHELALRRQGLSYEDIAKQGGGIWSTVESTRAASEQQLYDASAKRLKYLLREGVATVEIKSGYGLDLETERRMLRVARRLGEDFGITVKTTYLGAHSLPAEYYGRPQEYLEWISEEVLPQLLEEGLVDAVDGFCESIAFTPEQLEHYFEAAASFNIPIKCHVEQLSSCGGLALALEYGALSADHLEHAATADIKRMAATDTVAVMLPGAFYTLGETQKPPVAALREHGVPMAVATDANPGSSPMCSLLTAGNMAAHLFEMSPFEVWQGMTINAAKALGVANERGSLAVGKQADFVSWDIEHPDELIYYLGHNPCRMLAVNGVQVSI